MTSVVTVARIQDAWPDRDIDQGVSFWFEPGESPESAAMNEAWGQPRLDCEDDNPPLNTSTECKVSFTTYEFTAFTNSYWMVNRTFDVAAWPGQGQP